MLYLKAQPTETLDDLRTTLGKAIQLELSTLPLYLTALYSINPANTTNVQIAKILRSIAIQEMLHMAIDCNILNAVGGTVAINVTGFPPLYPGPLPMDVGTQPGAPVFIMPLQKLSMAAVNTFMTIEEPEDPIAFTEAAAKASAMHYHTIGQFYGTLSYAISKFGNAIFTGNPDLQVTGWFSSEELFPVQDLESAQAAISVIVEEGEGTSNSPLDQEGELAHYYKLAEIVNGRRLVPNASAPKGYSFTGPPIGFDPSGVFPMVDNPSQVTLPPGSLAAQMADQFDATYSTLLNALNTTFNGQPSNLSVALGLMYSLRVQAQNLMQQPIGNGQNAGPRWLFAESMAQG